MNVKEVTMSILQKMGYEPEIDEDGDIKFNFQLKVLFVIVDEDSDYGIILYPYFHKMNEGTEAQALTACNKLTRDLRFCKVYIEKDFEHITATCEFYYTDENSIENNISHALGVLGIVRSQFRETLKEYMS